MSKPNHEFMRVGDVIVPISTIDAIEPADDEKTILVRTSHGVDYEVYVEDAEKAITRAASALCAWTLE
jgi:hypothetical protein